MQQNIFINNVEIARANLIFDKYYDFKLSKGPALGYWDFYRTIASFDFSTIKNIDRISSETKWPGAINTGNTLNHIGLTGFDNGFKKFSDGNVSDDEIYDVFKNETYELPAPKKGELEPFFMTRVFDNTFSEEKNIEMSKDMSYISLKGGFFQGFFKLEDMCYQTLPVKIEDCMAVSMVIRPKSEYGGGEEQNIFYIGTRAENKFAVFYNNECEESENGYFQELISEDYLAENPYEYIPGDQSIKDMQTDDGIGLMDNKHEAVETDNKFIFFNETEDGFNAETWNEGDKVMLITEKAKNSENLFPLMHYGKNGMTVDDLEEVEDAEKKEYDVDKDLVGNAFSVFITKGGNIGYRYMLSHCDKEKTVIAPESEYSKGGLVKENEWSKIDIVFNKMKEGLMDVSIYVNGFLVLISKQIPELDLRGLADSAKKQEAVPYNISLGGGTDGLKNAIYPSEYTLPYKKYQLEENFSSSFYGDIKSFEIKEKIF